MSDEILDQDVFTEKVWSSVDWWEHKRKLYNIVLISFTVLLTGLIIVWDDRSGMQIPFDILEALIWLFGANLLYTLGLGCDLVLSYYRKKESVNVRKVLFVLGLGFSILWTFVGISLNSFQ